VGLLGIAVKLAEKKHLIAEGVLDLGKYVPALHGSAGLGVVWFALLAFSLYYFARKPLEGAK